MVDAGPVKPRASSPLLVGVLALGGLTLCGAVAYWISPGFYRTVDSDGPLTVEKKHLKLGEVWANQRLDWTLPIKNRSNNPVAIDGFSLSCNCVAVEPKSLVIPAGATVAAHLTLDLTRERTSATRQDARDYTVIIVPHTRGGSPIQAGWRLDGRVKDACVLTLKALQFEGESIVGNPIHPRIVVATGIVPLRDLRATCDRSMGSVRVTRGAGEPGRYELEILPRSDLPVGEFRFDVTVQPILPDGEQPPPITVPVSGMIVDVVQAVPSTIQFGAIAIGEMASETVLLQSACGKSFRVEAAEPGSEGVTVRPTPTGSAPARAYQISLRGERRGEWTSTVKFRIRSEDNKVISVPVCVSYFGLARAE